MSVYDTYMYGICVQYIHGTCMDACGFMYDTCVDISNCAVFVWKCYINESGISSAANKGIWCMCHTYPAPCLFVHLAYGLEGGHVGSVWIPKESQVQHVCAYVYVCMCVCVYIYIYIYIYIYAHTCSGRGGMSWWLDVDFKRKPSVAQSEASSAEIRCAPPNSFAQ
jgi:hypothetical protein